MTANDPHHLFDKLVSHTTGIDKRIPSGSSYAQKYMALEQKYQNMKNEEDFLKITTEELETLVKGEDPQDKCRSSWSRKINKLYRKRVYGV